MSNGLISLIDWRAVAAALGFIAIAAGLIAWQSRGNPDNCRGWLGVTALSLELLAGAMAVSWAVRSGGGLLPLLLALGFAGLALSKAVTVAALVSTWRRGQHGAVFVGVLAMLGAYTTVYLGGAFEGTLDTAHRTAQAAAQSAPVQALDAQLQAARERLAALAPYADPSRAHTDEQAQAAAQSEQAARIDALRAELDATRTRAASWATSDCSPKTDRNGLPYTSRAADACAEIQAVQAALDRAQQSTPAGAGGYSARHAEYAGLRQHVADLESQRAGLLETGGAAAAQAAGADDRFIGWLAGVTPERAAGLKWLFFVGAFDVLSLLLRLFGELAHVRDGAGESTRRYAALLAGGLNPARAAALLAAGQAGEPEPEPEPARRGVGFVTATSAGGAGKLADGPPPELRAEREPGEPLGFAGFVPPGHQAAPKQKGPPTNKPRLNIAAPMERIIYQGLERVPEHLRQVAGAGRVGKVDSCKDCGVDFQVETYNGTRCKSCARKAEASYRRNKARLKAKAK